MQRIVILLLTAVLLAGCGRAGVSPTATTERTSGQQGSTPTRPAGEPVGTPTQGAPVSSPSAATPVPPQPTQQAQPTRVERAITIDEPRPGATIANPVRISGSVTVSPFEATLVAQAFDAQGNKIGEGPIMAQAEMGQPGPFSGELRYSGNPARIVVSEFSANDGSVVVSAEVQVAGTTSTGEAPLDQCAQKNGGEALPRSGQTLTLPMHVLVYGGTPGGQAAVTIRWESTGAELTQNLPILEAPDGCGLVIGNVNWQTESMPPQPPEPTASVEVRDLTTGRVLLADSVSILRWDSGEVVEVPQAWLLGEQIEVIKRRIPRTQQTGTAALEELLWGPDPNNLAGFETALPLPAEVLRYPGRDASWGPRVRLLKLTIVDGVATADFSKELAAYGGGSLRVQQIRQQIEQTLLQFPSVSKVVIAIEGQTAGVLEP